MTKIDKTDLENIKLIVKESKINSVAKIKIKKNDYEIEITSNDFVENNVSVQKTEKNNSYDDLVILFEDWRLFEEPDLINGVHDYSVNSFDKKKPKYNG